MDALSQTLRVVRLTGAIFINARFTAPWCYQSPHADSAAPLLEPGAERVIIFHLITEGECYAEMEGQPPVRLTGGDAIVLQRTQASVSSNPSIERTGHYVGYAFLVRWSIGLHARAAPRACGWLSGSSATSLKASLRCKRPWRFLGWLVAPSGLA